MTMSLTLVNTSNWTNEMISVRSRRGVQELDPGERMDLYGDDVVDGLGVVFHFPEYGDAEPHMDEDGKQVFPTVKVDFE